MEDLTAEEKQKAKRYARLKYWLALANFAYVFVFLVAFLATGLSIYLARSAGVFAGPGAGGQVLYLVGFVLTATLVMMPLSFYQGYVVDHRFGLSNQTVAGWASDELKSTGLSMAILVPLGLGAYRLLAMVQGGWWVYAALLWTGFSFVLAYLAPVLIMPLFNKFQPVTSGPLRENILRLAGQAGVAVSDVFRSDMSKRTKKANAFFAGIGNTKRIVLGDTLMDDYTEPEILTVVGHEMGHWRLGHLWKATALNIVGALAGFYLADRFLKAGIGFFDLRGLDDPAGLPLIILALMILAVVGMPASNALSRRFERQADRFELELVNEPEATISTFKKLAKQNLADPSPHPVIEFLLYSHPSIDKRIAVARQYMKK